MLPKARALQLASRAGHPQRPSCYLSTQPGAPTFKQWGLLGGFTSSKGLWAPSSCSLSLCHHKMNNFAHPLFGHDVTSPHQRPKYSRSSQSWAETSKSRSPNKLFLFINGLFEVFCYSTRKLAPPIYLSTHLSRLSPPIYRAWIYCPSFVWILRLFSLSGF